jgi:hypothetical protein
MNLPPSTDGGDLKVSSNAHWPVKFAHHPKLETFALTNPHDWGFVQSTKLTTARTNNALSPVAFPALGPRWRRT